MSVCTFTVFFCCCGGGLKLLHFEKYASIIVRKYKKNTTQIIVKNTSLKGNMINGINRLGNGIGNQSLKLRRGRVHEGCWAKWIFETEELPRAQCKINEDYLEWIIQSYSSIFFKEGEERKSLSFAWSIFLSLMMTLLLPLKSTFDNWQYLNKDTV